MADVDILWRENYNNIMKDRIMARKYQSKYAKNHPNKIRQWCHEYDMSLKGRYHSYKNNAHRYNREFLITFDDFVSIVAQPCYYCHTTDELIGIDRKDNTKGYIIENCLPACTTCNFIKKAYTPDFFINHCKIIAKNFS